MTGPLRKVGYKRPPHEYRFKPGQSGNPKGRPKKVKLEPLTFADVSLDQHIEAEFLRPLRLQENGKTIELPAVQAVLRSMTASALKGNRLTQRHILDVVRAVEKETIRRDQERYQHYLRVKREGEAIIRKANERGLPLPELYPHPDDIIIDPATADVWILGPRSPEERVIHRPLEIARDLFLVLCAGASGGQLPGSAASQNNKAVSSAYLFERFNFLLPPSLQMDESAIWNFLYRWSLTTKTEYMRKLRALYNEFSNPQRTPRGILEERERTHLELSGIFDSLDQNLQSKLKELEHKRRER